MRRDSGFTAFEVAVTLAIVALLASVTMPPFLKWLQTHRLRGAAINLMADIEMAKVRAIREGTLVSVAFDENRYQVFFDDGATCANASKQRELSERLVHERQLPAGVRVALADLSLPQPGVCFDSRGQAPELFGAPGLIPLVNQTERKVVRVNRLGSVRIQ
jgi:prepilin-type N-terminal cleavage/methylation domain-containing protein